MRVNAETLHEKIQRWEGLKRLYGELSLNEEYQLEAYKMLLQLLPEKTCEHEWAKAGHAEGMYWNCSKCGADYDPD